MMTNDEGCMIVGMIRKPVVTSPVTYDHLTLLHGIIIRSNMVNSRNNNNSYPTSQRKGGGEIYSHRSAPDAIPEGTSCGNFPHHMSWAYLQESPPHL